MTFTVVARCPRTGALGVGTATGEMAVGSRVPFVAAGQGAVATQALTNPKLGVLGLNLLRLGYGATRTLAELAGNDDFVESRQLAVVDSFGSAAARTGRDNKDWKGHYIGTDYVAMGNKLVGDGVIEAMAQAFDAALEETLEERLCRALEAGRDAGGQPDGQHSAALLVAEVEPYPIVDLRVDHHEEPVGALRALLDRYAPLKPYYRARAADPSVGPWDEWLARRG
jgi:uncharacterized Ntn-hydrolase superfamily protein